MKKEVKEEKGQSIFFLGFIIVASIGLSILGTSGEFPESISIYMIVISIILYWFCIIYFLYWIFKIGLPELGKIVKKKK